MWRDLEDVAICGSPLRLPNVDRLLPPLVPPTFLPVTYPIRPLWVLPLLLVLPNRLLRLCLIDPLVVRFKEIPEPDRFDADKTLPHRAEPPPWTLGGERPKLVLRAIPRRGDAVSFDFFIFMEPSPTKIMPSLSESTWPPLFPPV